MRTVPATPVRPRRWRRPWRCGGRPAVRMSASRGGPRLTTQPSGRSSTCAPMAARLATTRRDAVRFLDPQLRGVAQLAAALRGGHGHGDERQLVDDVGHAVAADLDGSQGPPSAHGDGADRLGMVAGVAAGAARRRRRGTSMSAPISRSTSMMPMRDGLRPTPSRRISASGCRAPATSQAAADEMSPGTVRERAAYPAGPSMVVTRPSRRTGAPSQASMRSVWSRVGPGTSMLVVPSRRQRGQDEAADDLGAGHRPAGEPRPAMGGGR